MANILLKIGKGIEAAAEDVLRWTKEVETVTASTSPAVLAALGVLADGIQKCAADVAADASNPLTLLLGGAQQATEFLAVWPELKAVLEAFGITKI